MTLTLTPEIEARLRARAERDGQDVHALAQELLSDALAEDPDDLTDEQVAEIRAGIRRGLDAVAEGRERSLSAYAAEVHQRRTARNAEVNVGD